MLEALVSGRAPTLMDTVYAKAGCSLASRQMPEWIAEAMRGESPSDRQSVAWRHVEGCDRCRTDTQTFVN